MAQTFSQKMHALKRVVQLHANWLVYATLGESALSSSEVSELRKYGKLPMDEALDLVDRSYLLGKFRALLKRSEYAALTTEDVKTDYTPLTPLEELVVEQARLRAGQSLRGVAQEIADGTYAALSQSLGRAVSEAVVSQAVADETALAIINRNTSQELAANLAQRLQTHKRNWKLVAQTALHSAKVAGSAQAIVNKLGVYAFSDGADSLVSVVPGSVCCDDCRTQYLGPDGEPRIFVLRTLMGAGSNADGDVTHTKQNGKHPYWKTTLPPLHPSCGCSLKYVPPGHGWVNGKLSLINKSLFSDHLSKARSGVSGGISPTVEPKGAPSNQSDDPKPASVPGSAAPGNVAGPGRPSGGLPKPGSGTPGGMGGGKQTIACPLMHCPDGGHHQMGSKRLEEHTLQAQHTGQMTPEAQETQKKHAQETAKQYNAAPHPNAEIADFLANGKINSVEKLNKDAGINASFKVTMEGKGSGLMKPPVNKVALLHSAHKDDPEKLAELQTKTPEELQRMSERLCTPGAGTMPNGMNPHAEAAMSNLANAVGLHELYPTTVLRAHDGSQNGPQGMTSVQHWQDNAISTDDYAGKGSGYEEIMKTAPKEHKDKMHEQFSTIAVMDVVSNAGDRHLGNIMVNKESHDLIPIDHGTSFGNSLQGHRNDIAQRMHEADIALVIPPKLHARLKNQTLESTMRSLDKSGIPEWSQAQTYLRTKYALHMQDKFEHIPFDRIRPTVTSGTGEVAPYWSPGMGGGDTHGWNDVGGIAKFFVRQDEKDLPHDKFDGFAKAWMTERANDPTHPEHAEGKRLMEMAPLRSSAHVMGHEEATPESLKAHFDKVSAYDMSEPDAARIKRDMPKAKKPSEASAAASRSAPEMPDYKKTPVKGKGNRAGEPKSTMTLDDSDLEELDPKKEYGHDAHAHTGLDLDLTEFQEQKKPAAKKTSKLDLDLSEFGKSLYLRSPQSSFPTKLR